MGRGSQIHTIDLSYDELGRSTGQSINGVANTSHYDALGRMDSVTNALGTFGYHYDGVSPRLATIDFPNGQHTTFGYYDNLGDRALANITHLTSAGEILSKFDYAYGAPGRISDWTQQRGTQPAAAYQLKYDDADQLRDATLRDVSTNAVVKHFAYRYDAAGNRTTEQIDNLVATEIPNQLNQLITRKAGGEIKVRGGLTEPARMTVNEAPAQVGLNNQFEGSVKVESGNNEIEIVATDGNGNEATQRYQLNVPAAAAITQQYDANGNLTRKVEGSNATTYEWDAAGRLTGIDTGTGRSEFEYDGLNRRVRIVEKVSGTVVSDRRFVWSDMTLAEERDAAGSSATKRLFDQGVQVVGGTSGGNYYYSRDHLGSIRELIDSVGAVRARYIYDPTGLRTKTEGTIDADFGFTGHYFHQTTGLHLAPYRAYDSSTARWLSRDPISEEGGVNMYQYTFNNPVNWVDPLGLDVRIESTNQVGGLHRRVSVDTPSGPYGQSYGMRDTNRAFEGSSAASGAQPGNAGPGGGIVYPDSDPTRSVIHTFKTTPAEDLIALELLQRELNQTGPYHPLTRSCRDYSHERFVMIKDEISRRRRQQLWKDFKSWFGF